MLVGRVGRLDALLDRWRKTLPSQQLRPSRECWHRTVMEMRLRNSSNTKKAGHSWGLSGLCWRRSSGEEGNLVTCSGSRCAGRRSCRLIPGTVVATGRVRHQANIDPAILRRGPRRSCSTHRLILAQADQVNLVCRNVVLRRQILNHGIRAALAQIVIVVGRTNRIGSAFDVRM